MPTQIQARNLARETIHLDDFHTEIADWDDAFRDAISGYRNVVVSEKWGLLAGGYHVKGGQVRGVVVGRWSDGEGHLRTLPLDYSLNVPQPVLVEDVLFLAEGEKVFMVDPEGVGDKPVFCKLGEPWTFCSGIQHAEFGDRSMLVGIVEGEGETQLWSGDLVQNVEQKTVVPLGGSMGQGNPGRLTRLPTKYGAIMRFVVAGSDVLLFCRTHVLVGIDRLNFGEEFRFTPVELPGCVIEDDRQIYVSESQNVVPHVFVKAVEGGETRFFRGSRGKSSWTFSRAPELDDIDVIDPLTNDLVMTIKNGGGGRECLFFSPAGIGSKPMPLPAPIPDDHGLCETAIVARSSRECECASFVRVGNAVEVTFLKNGRKVKLRSLQNEQLTGTLLFRPVLAGSSCVAVLAHPLGNGKIELDLVAVSWNQ